MRVTPTDRRSHFENGGGSPRVVIPGHLSPVAIFLLLWVSFWTFGGVEAIQTFWQSVGKGSPEWFLAFWLVGWVAGESLVLGTLAYMLVGREIITLRPGQLEIRLQLLEFGFSRQYDISRVTNVRVSMVRGRNQFPSALAFDYGARTVRFGRGIDEAEAALVLGDLRATGFLPAA